MRTFNTVSELIEAAGQEVGVSEWFEIDQERVDAFADATGDHQWIHVDVDRANDGPFGGTIAHGYLTLSLVPWLGSTVFTLGGHGAKLNYGTNKVRFPNPVKVGRRVRDRVSIGEVTETGAGHQVTINHVIEVEGEEKPGCVAETVVLLLG